MRKKFDCIEKLDIKMTDTQRENIRKQALAAGKRALEEQDKSLIGFLKRYPWQTALGLAASQTAVCILTFGGKYVDFVCGIIGG